MPPSLAVTEKNLMPALLWKSEQIFTTHKQTVSKSSPPSTKKRGEGEEWGMTEEASKKKGRNGCKG